MADPKAAMAADQYVAGRSRLLDLAANLSEQQLSTPVPATPGWDVHDVVAHVAGLPADVLTGRLSGLPSGEFTARQVEQRRGAAVADLAAEWAAGVDRIADGLRSGLLPPNLAVDVITHEQDIRGALQLPRLADPAAIRFCVDKYARNCRHSIGAAGLPAVRLESSDSDFRLDADGATVTLRAPEFELFRALSGRRGERQVCALDWSADPAPYLAHINVFGALPAGDIVD
ncbi:MAG TPA: maleylpyruvate isomerase family mycothiol-dependent enzyme [Mycobacteriales bacterium]|nr:maleylpyruvate isomerase family mycothiol-dependent enzyme [Mycobacteriales bacterium]